jgi:hypothetical protein
MKMNMEISLQETSQEAEGGCVLINPFGHDSNVEITTLCINADDSINEWRVEFRDAVEALTEVHPRARGLYNRINAIWANNTENRGTLINDINNFIIMRLDGTLKKSPRGGK